MSNINIKDLVLYSSKSNNFRHVLKVTPTYIDYSNSKHNFTLKCEFYLLSNKEGYLEAGSQDKITYDVTVIDYNDSDRELARYSYSQTAGEKANYYKEDTTYSTRNYEPSLTSALASDFNIRKSIVSLEPYHTCTLSIAAKSKYVRIASKFNDTGKKTVLQFDETTLYLDKSSITINYKYSDSGYPGYTHTAGDTIQTVTYEGNPAYVTTSVPTWTGHRCVGWLADPIGGPTEFKPGQEYTWGRDIDLYTSWRKVYTITYSANGGENAPAAQEKLNDLLGEFPFNLSSVKPTRTGHSFLGWATSPDATEAEYASSQSYEENGDVTLYAVWEPVTYKITCNKSLGTAGTSTFYQTYSKKFYTNTSTQTSVSYITCPIRSGYTFNGYYDIKGKCVVDATGYINVRNTYFTEDQTITASWTSNGYSVTYYDPRNIFNSVPAPHQSVGGKITISSEIPEASPSSRYITLTYDTAGGNLSTGTAVRVKITNQDVFSHWEDTAGKSYNPGEEYQITSDLDLYVVYSTQEEVEKTYAPLPTKEGYTFLYWLDIFNEKINVGDLVKHTESVTLTAVWKEITEVRYAVERWLQKIDMPLTPSEDNYDSLGAEDLYGFPGEVATPDEVGFIGFTYYQHDNKTIAEDGSTVVNVYYTRNDYAITRLTGTGINRITPDDETFYQYGKTVSVTAEVESGYTFSDWTVDGDVDLVLPSEISVSFEMPACDIVITANAVKSRTYTYKVICHGNGGTYDGKDTYEYIRTSTDTSCTFTLDKVFERKPYTFSYWHPALVYASENITLNSEDADKDGQVVLDLYATWNPPQIKYHGNGGHNYESGLDDPEFWPDYPSNNDSGTYPYIRKETSGLFSNPNYKFVSWNTERDGSGKSYNVEEFVDTEDFTFTGPDEVYTVILYAQWEPLATMFVKVGNEFKAGTPYIKVNGTWKKAIGVYIKTSDGWKQSTR